MSTNADHAGRTRAARRAECSCRGPHRARGPGIVAGPQSRLLPRARGSTAASQELHKHGGPSCRASVGRGPSVSSRTPRLPVSPAGTRKPGSDGPPPAEGTERRVVTGHVREFADEHGNPQSAHSLASRSRLYRTRRQGNEPSALPPRIRRCDHGSWARETEPQPEARRHDCAPARGRRLRPRHRAP